MITVKLFVGFTTQQLSGLEYSYCIKRISRLFGTRGFNSGQFGSRCAASSSYKIRPELSLTSFRFSVKSEVGGLLNHILHSLIVATPTIKIYSCCILFWFFWVVSTGTTICLNFHYRFELLFLQNSRTDVSNQLTNYHILDNANPNDQITNLGSFSFIFLIMIRERC